MGRRRRMDTKSMFCVTPMAMVSWVNCLSISLWFSEVWHLCLTVSPVMMRRTNYQPPKHSISLATPALWLISNCQFRPNILTYMDSSATALWRTRANGKPVGGSWKWFVWMLNVIALVYYSLAFSRWRWRNSHESYPKNEISQMFYLKRSGWWSSIRPREEKLIPPIAIPSSRLKLWLIQRRREIESPCGVWITAI